ncbi:MAG: Flp family type IVb pilin [Gammaproteobacteria bacterium]
MKKLKNYIGKFSNKEEGATMVEYAIMVALIAIIAIVMIRGVGQNVNNTFSVVNSALTGG